MGRGRQGRPTAPGQQLVGEGPRERVGGRGLAVVEIQGGEGGGGQRPGVAHAAVHLLQGRHVARLGQQFDSHGGLSLPFGPGHEERMKRGHDI